MRYSPLVQVVRASERASDAADAARTDNLRGIGRELLSVCRCGVDSAAGGKSHGTDAARLLEQIGTIGGAALPTWRWRAMGLAIPTPAGAENFSLPASSGRGRSVVILGAGIAGLVSAYELAARRLRVTVLEARDRIGGRVLDHPRRRPDRPDRPPRPGRELRSPGLYFNAGPARIPSTHRLILGYARRLRCRSWSHSSTSTATPAGISAARSILSGGWSSDLRGHLAELLAKAIDRRRSTAWCRRTSSTTIRQFLAPYAQLGPTWRYTVPTGRVRLRRRRRRLQRSRRCRCRRSAFKELAPSRRRRPSVSVRAYLGHAGDDAPAGRRHGSDRARDLRAGEASGAAGTPSHRDPPQRRSACGSSTGRASR